MSRAASLPPGQARHESLSKPSSSEGSGVAAAHSSTSDRGLGGCSRNQGAVFRKKCHSWNLSGLTLARSCAKYYLCVCSLELSTHHRRLGHITLFILIFQVNGVLHPGPHAY